MFITRLRAAAPADRSPRSDFWFNPLGMDYGGGIHVTTDQALALPTALACVRNISEDFAKLPFRMYRPAKSGRGRDLVTNHWLGQLLDRRPNNWQTPFEFFEMLQGHLLLRGNAYCLIVSDAAGRITDLVPLHPDRVRLEMLDNGSFRYRVSQANGTQEIYRRDEIWHIRGFGSDGYVGLSPVQLQRVALGVGLSAQEYAARFFRNDAKPSGGWIEYPGKFADREARTKFRESWQEVQGGANRGQVAVLEQGMKYHEVGLNNKDSQFLETQQHGATLVCSIFRMPPHKVGLLDKATFSNIEQQNIEYATDTIHSWCERWECSIETQLLGPDTDIEVEFDLRILLRGDSKARADRASRLVMAGVITRNEARADEGLNPLDGLDEPLRPLNMAEESDPTDPEDPEDAGADPEESATDVPAKGIPSDDASAKRMANLVSAAVDRVVRKEAALIKRSFTSSDATPASVYAELEPFVRACLGVSAAEASAYTAARLADQTSATTTLDDFQAIAASRLERLALKGHP